MKILILEDDPFRIELFKVYLEPLNFQVTYCSQANEATAELYDNNNYDLIFLDHDLGGEVFVDSTRDDTGAAVARWLANEETIEGKPYNRGISIVIHSMNPAGQRNMQGILEAAGFNFTRIIPFSQIAQMIQEDRFLK